MAASWTCNKCTFINDVGGGENDACMICQAPREDSLDNGVDAAFGGCHRGRGGLDQNMRLANLPRSARNKPGDAEGNGSLAALGNMSFAAWESDRKAWTCKACTFRNEPRFLICGACGMAEGAKAVEDELITMGLERMSLNSAYEFLSKTVHKQLDSDREDKLRHERAVELLQEQIEEDLEDARGDDFEDAETANRKQIAACAGARKHLETLERIQKAERIEHQDMLLTIEQWRVELREQPNNEQEQEVKRQEELLDRLLKDWEDREKELRRLRLKLDGNTTSI